MEYFFFRHQRRSASRPVGRVADQKIFDGFLVKFALLEILPRLFSARRFQECAVKEQRNLLVNLQQGILGRTAAFVRVRPLQPDAGALGEHPRRRGKIHVLVLHHELEHVAARAAAEAVINLSLGVDVERGRLFLMERAKRLVRGTAALELEVCADDLDDVVRASDVFENVLGNDLGHKT